MSADIVPPPAAAALRQALDEQQARIWRLRSLAQCAAEAIPDGGAQIDDPLAALLGLVELADAIHGSANPDAVLQRVAEIEADAEREKRREERDLLAEGPESVQ